MKVKDGTGGFEYNPDEAYPLVGKTIDGIYEITDCIGQGGMCTVYQARVVNLHRLRAKEIIAGNMEISMLGLTPPDIGMEKEPEGKIEDPEAIAKIYRQADLNRATIDTILEEATADKQKDTRKKVQQQLITDTNKEFRPMLDEEGHIIVAVKVLNKRLSADKKKIDRFKNEGAAFKKLSHPNLVKAIDTDSTEVETEPDKKETIYYYAMELIKPYDFDQHFGENEDGKRREPLPVQFAIPVAKGVLKACKYLHEKGIVHRDIKPSNMMVEKKSFLEHLLKQGELDVRLSDLGLARLHFIEFESDSKDMQTQMQTQSADFLGTPHYISPEQAFEPKDAGPESDIWSLATSLYALLTGIHPFGDDLSSPIAVINNILNLKTPVHVRDLNKKVPQTLADLVMMQFKKIDIQKNENKEIVSVKSDRLTATELLLALDDYVLIEQNKHADHELASRIKKKQKARDLSGDGLALLLYEQLSRIEKDKISEKEYDGKTIAKRVGILETAIASATNKTRKAYLEKLLIYEKETPGYRPTIKSSAGRMKIFRKPALYALGAAAILGLMLGGIKLNTHLTRIGIYKSIRAGIQIEGSQQLMQGNYAQAKAIFEQSKQERKLLPAKYMKVDEILSQFEAELGTEENKIKYQNAEKQLDAAAAALKQRQLRKARAHTNNAMESLAKANPGSLKEYQTKKEELEKRIKDMQEILDTKDGAIATLEFVEQSYARTERVCERLEADLKDGAPFPEKEKVDQLKREITAGLDTLQRISPEFEENGKPTQEYRDLEEKMQALIYRSETLEFGIASEHLAALKAINTKLSTGYMRDNAPEDLAKAKTAYAKMEQIKTGINPKTISGDSLEKFSSAAETEKEWLARNEKTIQRIIELRKRAQDGDSTAGEIIALETKLQTPEKRTLIKNGITDETFAEYTLQAERYLAGENMRGDTYLQIMLGKLYKRFPEQREEINSLQQSTNPLFGLSRKIEQLNSEIEHNPENEENKKSCEQANTEFIQTAETLKEQFTGLNAKIKEQIQAGLRIADPHDYLFLGEMYSDIGQKAAAICAYKTALWIFYLGFPAEDSKTVTKTAQKIKELQGN